jgi:hypothetical protein
LLANTDLEILSNEALIDLGAQLEADLADTKSRLKELVEPLEAEQKRLVRPGVKLALNAAAGIGGLALAPITFGWSLFLTVVSGAVTISDAIDYSGEVSRVRAARHEIERLRQLLSEIVSELEDIHGLLAKRLDDQP